MSNAANVNNGNANTTKEVGDMVNEFTPKLKNWRFQFYKEATQEAEKEVVVKVISSFVDNFYMSSNNMHYKAPARFVLHGEVYGRNGFSDGDEVVTSDITQIDKVEEWKPDVSEWFSGKYSIEDLCNFEKDIYCATTKSGSKYYLDSTEMDGYMVLMLGTFIHGGSR